MEMEMVCSPHNRPRALTGGTVLTLLASILAPAVPSQDSAAKTLEGLVTACRNATTAEQEAKAWVELEEFVNGAGELPAASRTDALAVGLELDFVLFHARVFDALAKAPDATRAAHHLLRACRMQDEREAARAEQRAKQPDHEALQILGADPGMMQALEDLQAVDAGETSLLRGSLIEACIACKEPAAMRGLAILAAKLTPDPAADPIVDALLERVCQETVDGMAAVFTAFEEELDKRKDAREQAKRRRPRNVPVGVRKSDWLKSEKEVTERLVELWRVRIDRLETRMDGLVDRIRDYAMANDLPPPPRTATPARRWARWSQHASAALAKR